MYNLFNLYDEIEWYEDKYSVIKYYGHIIKINKVTAIIIEEETGGKVKVRLDNLNWQ